MQSLRSSLATRAFTPASSSSRRGIIACVKPTRAADYRALSEEELIKGVAALKAEYTKLQYLKRTRGKVTNPETLQVRQWACPAGQAGRRACARQCVAAAAPGPHSRPRARQAMPESLTKRRGSAAWRPRSRIGGVRCAAAARACRRRPLACRQSLCAARGLAQHRRPSQPIGTRPCAVPQQLACPGRCPPLCRRLTPLASAAASLPPVRPLHRSRPTTAPRRRATSSSTRGGRWPR